MRMPSRMKTARIKYHDYNRHSLAGACSRVVNLVRKIFRINLLGAC